LSLSNFCEICQVEFGEADKERHRHPPTIVFACKMCGVERTSRAEAIMHFWDEHHAPIPERDPGYPTWPPPASAFTEVERETNGGARLGDG